MQNIKMITHGIEQSKTMKILLLFLRKYKIIDTLWRHGKTSI